MAAAQAPIAPTRPETPHLATVPPRRIDRGFYYDFDYPEGFSGAFNPPPHLSPAAPQPPRAVGSNRRFAHPERPTGQNPPPPESCFPTSLTPPTVPSRPLADKDLKSIKKQMIKIINKDYPLRREEVTREEAERRIRELDEPYKLEILDAIKEEPITIYHIGDEWWDLCAGPHVESTKKIHPKAIDLESVAGAYWRGDETKPMLQRIYGTAWGTPRR